MARLVVAAALLLGTQGVASAQFLPYTTPPSGYGGFGGGPRPLGPSILPPPASITPPQYGMTGGIGGGFVRPGFPRRGFPFWGWGGGYGYPYYGYGPELVPYPVPVPVEVPAEPPQPTVVLSNEAAAVLKIEFPAAAEIWVNGEKAEGDPSTEWTLTSPLVKRGENFTFKIKAQWKARGKTFGYERTVEVAGGNNSRALVINGTEIK